MFPWRNFLRLLLPVASILVLAFAVFGRAQIDHRVGQLRVQDRGAAMRGADALEFSLRLVFSDLAFLAELGSFRTIVGGRADASARAAFADDLLAFARSQGLYAQLRWIDADGREQVRVNMRDGEARVVAPAQLQEKRDRYYFEDIFSLDPGVVYVSPLDLNVEQGAVEDPPVPVIRIGTPTFDERGVRRGILLLNFSGKALLERFGRATAGASEHVYLLNRDGYWLSSPRPADEWGFMLDRPEATLALRSPPTWALLAAAEKGEALRADGLWTWRTVRPLTAGVASSTGSTEAAGPSVGRLAAPDYHWKVVAHVSAEAIAGLRRQVWLDLLAPLLVLLGLSAAGCARLAQAWRRQALAETGLREANLSLRLRVEERTEALNRKVDALVEADMRYRTTFETAAVGIARVSPMGRFIEINEAFCELIGYRREEVLSQGFSFQQITHPDDLEADLAEVARLLAGEADSYALEKRYVRKDGSHVWANLSVSLVRSRDGTPRYFVSSVSDLSERKRLEAELLALANSDFLTGLANRRQFMEKLADELARLQRGEGQQAGVLMLDLDHFKRINDGYGHAAGDEVLRHFGVLASHDLRRIDTVGRIGGEEFAIILPGADAPAAEAFAERLRKRVAAAAVSVGEESIRFTVSIGVAVATARDTDVDSALSRADQALYLAKQRGRDRVESAADENSP